MNWKSDRSSREKVLEILRSEGIPLNLEVARICGEYIDANCLAGHYKFASHQERRFPLNRSDVKTLRELGHIVNLSWRGTINVGWEVDLVILAAIFCEDTDGVEILCSNIDKPISANLPTASNLAGTRAERNFPHSNSIVKCYRSHPFVLRTENGSDVIGVDKEDMFHNARNRLYGFLEWDIGQLLEEQALYINDDDPDLFQEFCEYVEKRKSNWWEAIGRFSHPRFNFESQL